LAVLRFIKYVMDNESAGFGGLNFFSLHVLSELVGKCVVGIGRFVRILENQ
jgi:hypothetical protein